MNPQTNSFPMFFTLEHVDNGYILSAKEETGSLTQEATFRREVVTEEKIHARIGQLFHPDALMKEHPVVFRVEAISENTYKTEENIQVEGLMEAKLTFAHFKSKGLPADTILALLIEDTKMIEVYGLEAERMAARNNIKVVRSSGIPMLRFPNTKDGQKHLASMGTRMTLINVSQEQILQWYASHQVEMENKSGK